MPVCDSRYRISRARTLAHRAAFLLPPAWRDQVAEWFFRRPGAPGPASEHVVQYVLSAARPARRRASRTEATVAHGADLFYSGQYRQYLNAAMGAFAMTATHALVASGGASRGWFWRRRRETFAAMLDEAKGAPPIFVLDQGTLAVPMLLPMAEGRKERAEAKRWLAGKGSMPGTFRAIVAGQDLRCADPAVHARERSADGSVLEVADAILHSGKLALLALHPHDPDAMGLHITLFGAELVSPLRLELDYGLDASALDAYRAAARSRARMLVFCVGGTEEAFTQCSQNLFIKRPAASPLRPAWSEAWDPRVPLERLLRRQFEMIQVTVSADGLPGASPRNGDLGKAAFVARRGSRPVVLIPYYPGNAVHGHAAKLWSNPHGTLVISDDHSALRRVTISGPAWVSSHKAVTQRFPAVAAGARSGSKPAAADPQYWFLQEVAKLVQEHEPLSANSLDPGRPTCSISAGGQAHHGKKPAYFAADTLPSYDRPLQHEREAEGRPICPSGASHHDWLKTVEEALKARREHLERDVAHAAQGCDGEMLQTSSGDLGGDGKSVMLSETGCFVETCPPARSRRPRSR